MSNHVYVTGGRLAWMGGGPDDVRAKSLPGHTWNRRRGIWTFPATPAIAESLADIAGTDALEGDAVELFRRSRVAVSASQAKTSEDLPDHPSKTASWLHQKRAYEFAKDLAAVGLFMDMGTGKSKVVVDLVANGGDMKTLILCPKSVLGVWPAQFAIHSIRDDIRVVDLRSGTVRDKASVVKQALADAHTGGYPVVVVVNYESAWRDPLVYTLMNTEWDRVVLDESHRLKSPVSKTSLCCVGLGRRAKRRVAMTGTPMGQNPLDVFTQYSFLDVGIFGGSKARFAERYAVLGGYGGQEIRGYKNLDELQERMYSIAFRVESRGVLDLPPTLDIVRTFKLSPTADRMHRTLSRDMYAGFEGGSVTVQNALTKMLRLQQLTSGFAVADDTGEPEMVDNGKMSMLSDVLGDLGRREPVVVFAYFRQDLDNIAQVAAGQGRRYGEVSGRRHDLTRDERMPDNIDVLGVQLQSGGAGVDLTRASYAVYYSAGVKLDDYKQSRARVHRPGQSRSTTFIHLLADNSIDTKIHRAMMRADDVIQSVLREEDDFSFTWNTEDDKR